MDDDGSTEEGNTKVAAEMTMIMEPEVGGMEVLSNEQSVGNDTNTEPEVGKSKHMAIRAMSLDSMDVVVTEQMVGNKPGVGNNLDMVQRIGSQAESEPGMNNNMETGQRVGNLEEVGQRVIQNFQAMSGDNMGMEMSILESSVYNTTHRRGETVTNKRRGQGEEG